MRTVLDAQATPMTLRRRVVILGLIAILLVGALMANDLIFGSLDTSHVLLPPQNLLLN